MAQDWYYADGGTYFGAASYETEPPAIDGISPTQGKPTGLTKKVFKTKGQRVKDAIESVAVSYQLALSNLIGLVYPYIEDENYTLATTLVTNAPNPYSDPSADYTAVEAIRTALLSILEE